jgi:hypothetical protein
MVDVTLSWLCFGVEHRCRFCAHRSRSCATNNVCVRVSSSVNADRAALGIEPRTSRTRSENHTTRPSSQLTVRGCVFGGRAAASALCIASEAVAARARTSQTNLLFCVDYHCRCKVVLIVVFAATE